MLVHQIKVAKYLAKGTGKNPKNCTEKSFYSSACTQLVESKISIEAITKAINWKDASTELLRAD